MADAHLAQAFAVLLPVRSVGVMGDQRTYQETAALRAVTTEDFMTADWAHLPYELLGAPPTASLTKCRVSTGWFTTSPANRLPPLSGSDQLQVKG